MNDEKYAFVTDIAEKRATARSARNRRTHTGKGGSVRLPSDNLSKKEIMKMSGEMKTYRLNEPMKFAEFNAMPDDLKITYIKAIREKYGAPDKVIAEMFGLHRTTLGRELGRLGLSLGKGHSSKCSFNSDGWYAWLGVDKREDTDQEAPEQESTPVIEEIPVNQPVQTDSVKLKLGSVTLRGKASVCLDAVKNLLSSAMLDITVSWREVEENE